MIIVGIDPGFTGAIAFLDPGSDRLLVHDMPVFKEAKGKTVLNLHQLGTILKPDLDDWSPERCVAVLEQVHAMKGQGLSSTFRFGEGYGAIQMALVGHGYETNRVSPSQWKRHFKLSKDKGVSRSVASDRFPNSAHLFERVKDDGRAEAVLMALYGKEVLIK